MSSYNIRHAAYADKENLIAFLNTYWGSKHPLVNNVDFFEYYYNGNGKLQFCLAEDENGIAAVCGYVLCNLRETPDIWVSIWCARKDAKGVGLTLMGKMQELTNCRVLSCNNIRENTMPFYAFLGYTALRLPHYYRLADKAEYSIANITKKNILPAHGSAELVEITSATELENMFVPQDKNLPFKDLWYIARRYFAYPMQKSQNYRVFGVLGGKNTFVALLVLRVVPVSGVNVMRIVDFIGAPELFCDIGISITNLMEHENAEYADMYCYGIDASVLAHAGFTERLREDANVIPNYLDPPLYENTEYFFFTSGSENFTMFKADGDQDRPNI